MSVIVKGSDEKFTPFFLSGKWWSLITFASTRGFNVIRKSSHTQLEFSDSSYLSLDNYLEAGRDEITVENYPVFLSLDSSLYESEVPEGFPDREIVDEDGNITILKWSQWGSSDHVDLTDETKGIPLVYNYKYITNLDALIINDLVGYVLLNQDSYRELIPQIEGV
jgi:hypothetical protein